MLSDQQMSHKCSYSLQIFEQQHAALSPQGQIEIRSSMYPPPNFSSETGSSCATAPTTKTMGTAESLSLSPLSISAAKSLNFTARPATDKPNRLLPGGKYLSTGFDTTFSNT